MKKSIILPVILFFVGVIAVGQTTDGESLLQRAERLRKAYRFNEAIELYKNILEQSRDSLFNTEIHSLIAKSENGINMLQYATRPVVTAKGNVPVVNFHLYYPAFSDSSWAAIPDSISTKTNPFQNPNSLLIQPGLDEIYFSAPNEQGIWNIFRSTRVDGDNWSYPEPLNNLVNSDGDELFPVLSRNGRELYFSSTGHFGIGGFDLYVSYRDPHTNDWGLPQNLGFPYSSVDNDLLIIHSDNGLYTYIASDRNTLSRDSITIYRLEFENNPVKRAVSSIAEAVELSALNVREIIVQKESTTGRDVMTSPETEEYTKMIMEVRKIQREIDSTTRDISANRLLYNTLTNPDDRALLERRISEGELSLLDMQSRLRVANQVVQTREMDFLSRGTILPRREDFVATAPPADTLPETPADMILSKKELGPFPEITILEPIKLFDYTFAIGEESVMAEDSSYPQGLVYRIQLFAVASQSKIDAFKGLRPIFENRNAAGRFIYSAGQFFSYEEANEALARVRRAGFPSAIITAFNNGVSTTVRNARTIEQQRTTTLTFQIKVEGYPQGIPQPVIEIIRANTDRDIAKKVVNGQDIYYIGPFSNRPEAEQILSLLTGIGAEGLSVEEIINN